MDYIRSLGPLVLDHRFRRLTEVLLRSADETYTAQNLAFRAKWASTYTILRDDGPTAIGELAIRLRLTHPAIIGISDEMLDAGLITTSRDKTDGRRRILALTAKGRGMDATLRQIWQAMAVVQENRFKKAGCDIVQVIDAFEDGMAERSIADEVIAKISSTTSRRIAERPKRKSARRAGTLARTIAFAVLIAIPAAQAGAQTPRTVGSAERAALIKALSDSLIGGYIYEKIAGVMADSLNAALQSGAFDSISDGQRFATKINQMLRKVADDRHLGVSYATPSPNGGMRMRRVRPATDTVTPATGSAAEYGFGAAEILPGNIGYLDIRGFSGDAGAIRVVDSLVAQFSGVRALVIDLGRNRGGGPQVIQHLSAYLFEQPTHLVSSFMRGMEKPMDRWTSNHPNAGKLAKIPVFLLTSNRTISAPESFAFGLRANNRVTIVGEHTAGGGHFGDFIQLTPGFTMFLPRGRTYDPRTNRGWEAEGLKPDVDVTYEKALETALQLARKL